MLVSPKATWESTKLFNVQDLWSSALTLDMTLRKWQFVSSSIFQAPKIHRFDFRLVWFVFSTKGCSWSQNRKRNGTETLKEGCYQSGTTNLKNCNNKYSETMCPPSQWNFNILLLKINFLIRWLKCALVLMKWSSFKSTQKP